MDVKYYNKGRTFNKSIIQKLKKDCRKCNWCDINSVDKNFIGYTEEGKVFDLCYYLIWKQRENLQKRENDYVENFEKTKNNIIESIKLIKKFINSLTEIMEIKNNTTLLKKKIENGYVFHQETVSKNKKKRRYKKDNKRYLIDSEIEKLKEDISNLEILETSLSKKIKLEELIFEIIEKMESIDINLMIKFNNRFEWHETAGLYKDYEKMFNSLKLKVNYFSYVNSKEKYKILDKNFDLDINDIKIFEETYTKVMEKIEEDKVIRDMMEVKSKRKLTKKAKFYIDEDGNRIELDQNIEQVVLHK